MNKTEESRFKIISSNLDFNKISKLLNKKSFNKLIINGSRITKLIINNCFKEVFLYSLRHVRGIDIPSSVYSFKAKKTNFEYINFINAIHLKKIDLTDFISKRKNNFTLNLSKCIDLEDLCISDIILKYLVIPDKVLNSIYLYNVNKEFFYNMPFLNTKSLLLDLKETEIDKGKLFISCKNLKELCLCNIKNIQEMEVQNEEQAEKTIFMLCRDW
jgi:hypothetical protein